MAGPLLSLHVVSTMSLQYSLILIKSCIPSWLPQAQACSPPGPWPWALTCWLFLSCTSQALSFCFPGMVVPFFPRSPCLQTLKSGLCLPVQPLTSSNFFFLNQSKPTGDRDAQHLTYGVLTCGILCNFGNPVNVIQVLNQIHNGSQAARQPGCSGIQL